MSLPADSARNKARAADAFARLAELAEWVKVNPVQFSSHLINSFLNLKPFEAKPRGRGGPPKPEPNINII